MKNYKKVNAYLKQKQIPCTMPRVYNLEKSHKELAQIEFIGDGLATLTIILMSLGLLMLMVAAVVVIITM